MLFDFLKDKKLCSGSFIHYIILFNLNSSLDNVIKVIDIIKRG